ncbi:MAG: translation elongation factor Ts [Acidimicrobiales bacterium]
MGKVDTKDLLELRRSTGAGMLDAKKALEESGGDVERARTWLRERGLASAASRGSRSASQGAVQVIVGDGVSAVAELVCETDFVAKAPEFLSALDALAQRVVSDGEDAARTGCKRELDDLTVRLKENISAGRLVQVHHPEGAIAGSYVHVQNGRGVNGVLVVLDGGSADLAHDVAVHVAFAKPTYLAPEDVPAAEVDAERATLEALSRNEGKPEAALAKIVDGRLRGWFKERCLLEQGYVRDEKRTISDILGDAHVLRFVQVIAGG